MPSKKSLDEDVNFDSIGPVSRLETPLSLDEIMSNTTDFSIKTNDQYEMEEEMDMSQVYSMEDLEPLILLDNLEGDGDENDDPKAAFPRFRERMHNIMDDGKVMKMVEKIGGGEPIGNERGMMSAYVHYSAYIEFNECPYDSSRLKQKKPMIFNLGVGEILPGVEIAVRTMKKGERSKFLIHPDLAFKEQGVPPRIPGNATLLFDIELIDFAEKPILPEDCDSDDESQMKQTLEDRIRTVKKLRNEANKQKKHQKNINHAISLYRKGVYLLVQCHYKDEAEEEMAKKELAILYANLAVCYMNKELYKRVCIMYNDAVHDCQGLAEKNEKLLYLSGKALRFLGSYKESAKRLKAALAIKPGNEDIKRELKLLEEAKKKHDESEKSACKRMFGFTKHSEGNDSDDDGITGTLDPEFCTTVREQLLEFKNDERQDTFNTRFGASLLEQEFFQRECQKLGLTFRVTSNSEGPTFHISRKL